MRSSAWTAAAMAAVTLSMPLGGCQALKSLGGGAPATNADRSLYAAETAFDAASTVLDQAAATGTLTGVAAAKARAAYEDAHAALAAARNAKTAGDRTLETAKSVEAIARSGEAAKLALGAAAGS